MGGHGGLNILPQKKWNVYNFENREKVRKDEEAAAREEQIKRDQSRRRDAELRIDLLRRSRGHPSNSSVPTATTTATANATDKPTTAEHVPDDGHFNLFDGAADFSSLSASDDRVRRSTKKFDKEKEEKNSKKRRWENRPAPPPPVVGPEDEKYKLGYGLAGKGVKAPWYVSKPSQSDYCAKDDKGIGEERLDSKSAKKSCGRKTIEELREERLKREKQEKERECKLLAVASKRDGGFSRRRM